MHLDRPGLTDDTYIYTTTGQWTYVLGFYEPGWLLKNIFDMNQAELECATEKLSNMLESEDIMKWCNEGERVEMINQTIQVPTPFHLFLILHHACTCVHRDVRVQMHTRAHTHAHTHMPSRTQFVTHKPRGAIAGLKRV